VHWAHKNLSNAEIITQAEVYLTYDQISPREVKYHAVDAPN
jgi:hypothetical protein